MQLRHLLEPVQVCLRNRLRGLLLTLLLLLIECSSVPQPSSSVTSSSNKLPSSTEELGGICPMDGWNQTLQGESLLGDLYSRTLKEVDGFELSELLLRSRNSEHKDKDIISVFFYEPACPFSAQLRPIMEMTAKSFPSVKFVAVNGGSQWKVVARHFIRGFPSVLFYDKGKQLGYYQGARTLQGLRTHIEEISGVDAIKVDLPATFRTTKPGPKVPLSQNLLFVLSCVFLAGNILRHFLSLCPCPRCLSNRICFSCLRTRGVLKSVNAASSITCRLF